MSIESFFIEINIRKKKWLLVCTCNPNKNLISNHLKEIGKNLDNYSSKYDNFILLGDLNSEPTESAVRDFCEIYSCKNLIKDNTCFKNPSKPSCIFFFFFYLGFLSRTFTIHGTTGEGGGYLFNSSLPLPPASQALRH